MPIGYWIDFPNKRVYASECFINEAKNMASDAFKAYMYLINEVPDFKIVKVK